MLPTTPKPLMMMSLPNSGTTWLGDVIARFLPRGPEAYTREYFNPVFTYKHDVQLRRFFGADLVSCYHNLALADAPGIDECIRDTFFADGRYDFTKEVFSPFKLGVFARHFDCFLMMRSAQDSLPPNRVRVWNSYEHIWHALKLLSDLTGMQSTFGPLTAKDTYSKAYEAHAICDTVLRADAARLGVPVIEFQDLMFGTEASVRALLEPVLSEHVTSIAELASEICRTRKVTPRYELKP